MPGGLHGDFLSLSFEHGLFSGLVWQQGSEDLEKSAKYIQQLLWKVHGLETMCTSVPMLSFEAVLLETMFE